MTCRQELLRLKQRVTRDDEFEGLEGGDFVAAATRAATLLALEWRRRVRKIFFFCAAR
jgi:hypothetical protein